MRCKNSSSYSTIFYIRKSTSHSRVKRSSISSSFTANHGQVTYGRSLVPMHQTPNRAPTTHQNSTPKGDQYSTTKLTVFSTDVFKIHREPPRGGAREPTSYSSRANVETPCRRAAELFSLAPGWPPTRGLYRPRATTLTQRPPFK